MPLIACEDGHDKVLFESWLGTGTGCPACRLLDRLDEEGIEDLVDERDRLECELEEAESKVASLTRQVDSLKRQPKRTPRKKKAARR